MDPRPNVLWICSDQQRWDTLGCYGNPFVRTPHLDRLAAQGVLFEHTYSQSPVCTPSRTAFLTGRYPRTARCRQNGQGIPEDEVLITRLLAESGYRCGLAGKLHLSPCQPTVCKGGERRIRDGYQDFHWSHHPDPHWPENEYAHWLTARGVRFERQPFADSAYVQTLMAAEHHQTTWCAETAIAFLEERARDRQPWLFSVNLFDPHHPFDPPAEYLERYRAVVDRIPPPNYVEGELDDKPSFQQIDHRGAYGHGAKPDARYFPCARMTAADHRWLRAAYWAMVDLIDAQVGRLLEALERSGQREHTLVIFTSDHGEMLGDHGLYLKGPYFYDPAVRVPLLVSWPGVLPAGRRCPALTELMDLAPTVLDAVGLPHPAGLQARSLWPLLTGTAPLDTHRADVYCEYFNALTSHRQPAAHATMVRTARHKIVVQHGTDPGELYDLERDPAETHNLWHDPQARDAKLDLLQRVCDRLAWTVDPLPVRQSGW